MAPRGGHPRGLGAGVGRVGGLGLLGLLAGAVAGRPYLLGVGAGLLLLSGLGFGIEGRSYRRNEAYRAQVRAAVLPAFGPLKGRP